MYSRHITLICPPVYIKDKLNFPFTNLSLGYIAAYLRKHKHRVTIIDAVNEKPNRVSKVKVKGNIFYQKGICEEEILKLIPEKTDLIGITAPSNSNAAVIHQLVPKIKNKFPKVLMILGGSYPSSLPEESLSSGADYVIKGEGEVPILKLLEGENPLQIKGVISKQNLDTACSNFAEVVENLDNLPFPAYDLLPLDKYLQQRQMAILSSRGCAYRCNFCVNNAVYNFRWRGRSAENVLEEIDFLTDKYEVRDICFLDDNLIIDRQRATDIFEGMIKIKERLNNNFNWRAFCGLKVDLLDYELLIKIKKSGCKHILLPIENGDPAILKSMNRTLDLQKTEEIIRICSLLNITTSADYIIGYPGETKKSFLKSIDFFKQLKRLGLGSVIIYKTKPFPQTDLYEYCRRNGFLVKEKTEHTYFLTSVSTLKNKWVGIVTDDFSAVEINRRQYYAYRILNPQGFYEKMFPICTWLLKKIKSASRKARLILLRRHTKAKPTLCR